MQPTRRETTAALQFAAALRGGAEAPPFSFTYDGSPVAGLIPSWTCDCQSSVANPDFTLETATYADPRTHLSVRAEVNVHSDFAAVEWVLYLRNDGPSDTPLIEGIQALDTVLPVPQDQPCIVRYARGSRCWKDDYGPVERSLAPNKTLRLQPGGGRSSSEVLPFFNVDLGHEGVILATGWTGEWAAEFLRDEDGSLRVRSGMDLTRLKLRPGEEIRTPRMLLLFWEGDRLRGHNMLRRFILKHHRPRPNGEPLIAPLTNCNWGGTPAEVHLNNIRKIAEHALPFEYYWIDAGWFGGEGHWMVHAGNWKPRADFYPEDFRPIRDLLRRCGRKFLLWFEPERVAPDTPWAREHADWLLEVPPDEAICWADYDMQMAPEEWLPLESHRNQLNPGDMLLNLGDPDARRFLTDFLSDRITEFGIDCFRQDSNIAQLAYWRNADQPDRQGITEIRYVEGQYALWDELLDRHPHLIIDNCGSGSRRVDLESIGRATPLWRTDYVHLDPGRTAPQCHTYGLLHWVPLNGTTVGYLNDMDPYRFRSSMCSAVAAGLYGRGDAQQDNIPEDYPFDQARALLEEYLSIREYYYGDYYPLTEYSHAEDAWMAYQLDRPERGDGLVVVLKRPLSHFTRAAFPLCALPSDCNYEVTDLDTSATRRASGAELSSAGLVVELPGRPDSALIQYSAVG